MQHIVTLCLSEMSQHIRKYHVMKYDEIQYDEMSCHDSARTINIMCNIKIALCKSEVCSGICQVKL